MIPKNATPEQALLYAQIMQESGGNPQAVSPKGAAGIMQIMPDTARDPGYGVKPLQGWDGVDPRTAPVEEQIRFGNDYRNALTKKFGSVDLGLAAYNAGAGNVQKYGGIPPFKETQNYVASIKGKMNATGGGVQMASDSSDDDWLRSIGAVEVNNEQPAMSDDDWLNSIGAKPVQVEVVQPITQQPQTKPDDFYSRVGERLLSRANEGADALTAYRNNEQGLTQTAIQLVGKPIVGTALDVGAEGVKSAAGMLPEAVKGGARDVASWLAETPVGVAAIEGATQLGEAYGGFAKENPNAARTIESVGNIGSVVPAGLLARPIVQPIAKVTQKVANPAIEKTTKMLTNMGESGVVAKKAAPVASQEATKALARRATEDFGIDLSLDQVAPSRVRDTVQKVSQSLPGSGVDAFQETQRSQWMKAVAREIGQDTDSLGPETITKFLDDTSNKFDGIVKGKPITIGDDAASGLDKVLESAKGNITKEHSDIVSGKVQGVKEQLFKIVKSTVDEPDSSGLGIRNSSKTVETLTQRKMNGEKLASIRSKLVKDLPNVAGDARKYVAELVDVIDDIAAKNLSPEDVEKLKLARREWRNYKTLEPLLEKSTDGTINPTQLMQRVASSKYIKASRKGLGDDNLVDLARIGKQFMAKKGGSDTQAKQLYEKALLGNAALAFVAPQAAIPAMLLQGGAVAANRGYQSLINQSKRAVKSSVKAHPDYVPNMLRGGQKPAVTKSP